MREALQRAWLRRGWLAWLLWPVSLLFHLLVASRRALYRAGLLGSTRLPVPVIVVGNLVVGGGGKTPVVLEVIEHLRRRGLQPGVVSRGYGRAVSDCREVHEGSSPMKAGDEPLLIKQRSGVPVFVAPRRVRAARALLAAYPQTQVIVSDDGLQHYAMERDVEVCVFDERGVGNGLLLPAGPLREPWRRVDLVLWPGSPPWIDGFAIERRLAGYAQRADGTRIPLPELRGRRLKAIAGIARPEAFFRMLRAEGIEPTVCEALPDHADLSTPREEDVDLTLVCTEKDAVKLWRHRPDAWAVPLAVRIDESFWIALDRLLARKLSSADGSETA